MANTPTYYTKGNSYMSQIYYNVVPFCIYNELGYSSNETYNQHVSNNHFYLGFYSPKNLFNQWDTLNPLTIVIWHKKLRCSSLIKTSVL
jgi:hypothetical protein